MAKQRIEDLIPLPTRVPLGSKFIEVRGLTLIEIIDLLKRYKEDVLAFINGGGADFDRLVVNAPVMVAEMIALAADTPDEVEQVKRLPFAAQTDIVMVVWELSVPDLKKLGESLAKAGAALRSGSPASIPDYISPPSNDSSNSSSSLSNTSSETATDTTT